MPRGWTSGPNGETLPVSTSERAMFIMKFATGEAKAKGERGLARARPSVLMAADPAADVDDEYPMYGPGLPPPGGWGDEEDEQAP